MIEQQLNVLFGVMAITPLLGRLDSLFHILTFAINYYLILFGATNQHHNAQTLQTVLISNPHPYHRFLRQYCHCHRRKCRPQERSCEALCPSRSCQSNRHCPLQPQRQGCVDRNRSLHQPFWYTTPTIRLSRSSVLES